MYHTIKLRKKLLLLPAAILLWILLCTGASVIPKPAGEELSLGIIMYHGFAQEQALQNQYMIDPSRLEEDLQYLTANGYHTIFLSELIAHVEQHRPLPEKPVLLTFDDGYYNNYRYAFPLLKKYRCKAVISPIAKASDDAENEQYRSTAYSQCRWSELQEMCGSGLVELQNHTYDLHHISGGVQGAAKRPDESLQAYEQRLRDDLGQANRRIAAVTGSPPAALTLPFGAGGNQARELARSMGFHAVLDCEEKLNAIRSADDLFHLHRFLRPNRLSSEDFFAHTLLKQS